MLAIVIINTVLYWRDTCTITYAALNHCDFKASINHQFNKKAEQTFKYEKGI